jgi:RNA polymerase sigma-70 factor (ECF subfamily)
MLPFEAPDNDIQLMLQVKLGDGSSFAMLLEKHQPAVQGYLYRRVRNRAIAEELAQEVFLRVYRARSSYEPTARFKAWLYQIASHLGANSRRDRRREVAHDPLDDRRPHRPALQVPDRGASIEERLLFAVKCREVREAVAELPDKQRAAVWMHKFGGKEYADIARELDLSESAVKSLMFRAHEKLRGRLAHLAS